MKKDVFYGFCILCAMIVLGADQVPALAQTATPTPPPIIIRTSGQVCKNETFSDSIVCDPPNATPAPTTSSYQRFIERESGARQSSINVTATATSMQAQMASKINYPHIGGPALIRNTNGSLYVEVLIKDTPADIYTIALDGTRNVQQSVRQSTTGWGTAGCPCNSAEATATATVIAPFSISGTAASLGGSIVTLSEYPGVNYRRAYSGQFSTGALGTISNWDYDAGLFADAMLSINLSASVVCLPFPIEIKLAAFIPGEYTLFPEVCLGLSLVPPSFEPAIVPIQIYDNGNNRGFRYDADDKDNDYKVQQIACFDIFGCRPTQPLPPLNRTGLTRSYAADAVADGHITPEDDDRDSNGYLKLNDCRLLHKLRRAEKDSMRINYQSLGDKKVKVVLQGDVKPPTTQPIQALVPAIYWNIEIVIDASGASPTYDITGYHDGFPSWELYINKMPVYLFDVEYDHGVQYPPPYLNPLAYPLAHMWGDGDISITRNGPKRGNIQPISGGNSCQF